MAKKSAKPKREDHLDEFVPYFRGKGEVSIAIAVRDVLNEEHPSTTRVNAAIDSMKHDERFVVTEKGLDSTAHLVGEDVGEPEELHIDSSVEVKADQVETPTIGERVAAAETAPDLAAPTGPAAPPIDDQRAHDVERARTERETHAAELGNGITALENAIQHVSTDLKEKKDRLKVLRSELVALVTGDTQTRIPSDEDDDEVDPADTPIGKAISGEAPMIGSPFTARGQGATAAAAGKTELDCPFTRETAPKAIAQWLDGFREAKRADHSEREAQVQALFRDALVENALDAHGILPAGEECPKVPTVEFDGRRHLVLDMLAADEGPTPGVERWSLAPLFTKAEWDEQGYGETYGPPIAGADANDEAKVVRIRGGIDCARLVKSGRFKLVVGPIERLTVVTTKPEAAEASAAS